ncbi:MAG TPA: calcium-binding EGF-like domain-containing protein, partial [Polyangiaceae bacterium]|nr:calcium-binding EGF-like domain-containing protein [Polyangiaceae bacterium]
MFVAILVMLAFLIGCGGKTTQAGGLELILETDMATPATFDTVNVKIQQEEATDGGWSPPLLERDYLIPRELSLPTTIALVAGSSPFQEVLITVTGLAGGANGKEAIVQRVLKTQVPNDRVLEVLVVLSSNCLGKVKCPAAGDSCQPDNGMCGPGSPPPLLPFSPSDLADAGVFSTASDAGPADGTAPASGDDAREEGTVDATSGASDGATTGEVGADGPAIVEGGGDGAPIDPCAVANGGCASMATCTPTDGGARTCACNQGYQGDGLTCSPSAACMTNNGGCSANAKCSGTGPGTRMCACAMGYSGDGITCTAIDSCKTNNGGCSANAKCTGTGPGTNSCACNSGYMGDGVTCTGIQACATNNGGCAATAKCTSTGANTRTCACNTGYSGDGMTCTPINSCTTSNGGCGTNAACTSTGPGTNTCACNGGYTGDGVTCTAINACKTNNGGCSSNATCTSTGPNTRTCACNGGYSGDGVTCTAINSCLTNNGGCGAHQTCASTGPGTNSCTCNTDAYCSSTAPVCANTTTYVTCAQDAQGCYYSVAQVPCGANKGCQAGSCSCNAGWQLCNGSCVPNNDPNNCGYCGNICG